MALCNDENKNQRIYDVIRNQSKKFICVNDQFSGDNYGEVNDHIVNSFRVILPKKSSFEL